MGGWFRFAHVEMTIFRTLSRVALPLLLPGATGIDAQDIESRQVIVQAEAENAQCVPVLPDLSHGRISTLTKSICAFTFQL